MSTHVLVGDGSPGRTHKIPVTSSTTLVEVLQAGCKKFNMSPEGRTLKKVNTANTAALDLSLTVKLANLPQGARLEIIRAPRAGASAQVTIGLQIMDGSNRRLTGKFPASSTIWHVLTTLERESTSSPQGGINLTEKAASSGTKDGGRLLYVRPVVQVGNKEVADLGDLAATLASLGFTKGSHLFRVKFQETQIPFEQALGEIAQIFGEEPTREEDVKEEREVTVETTETQTQSETAQSEPAPEPIEVDAPGSSSTSAPTESTPSELPPPPGGISVFKAHLTSTTTTDFNESDYEIDQTRAQIHQKHLQEASQGRRLPSDREIEEKKQTLAQKARSTNVDVRIRFPDGLFLQKTFKGTDTAEDLYEFVKSCLRFPDKEFNIYLSPPHRNIARNSGGLFLKCGFSAKTLVNFAWAEGVSEKIKKESALREEFVQQARDLPVTTIGEGSETVQVGGGSGGRLGGPPPAPKKSGGKLPKWLTLGKK